MIIGRFNTSSRQEYWGLEVFAWARYKRGAVPTKAEYDEINRRVIEKLPNAELVDMSRRFVPAKEPTEVWWEFKWIDFSKKKGVLRDKSGNRHLC